MRRPEAEPAGAPTDRRAVLSWVLYDLANVIFSLSVLSLYFPLWVTEDAGGRDGHYALANSASMAAALLVAPVVGALADVGGHRNRMLAVATLGCCAATAFLGSVGLWWSLACFVVANVCYQGAIVVYDGLLPAVSEPANRGRISGYGIAAGFAGALVAITVGLVVLGVVPDGKPLVFRLTALLFLLGALPCVVWVREDRPEADRGALPRLRQAVGRARRSTTFLRANPCLARFLIGRFCYADATNTLVAFLGIYATRELGFSDLRVQLVLLAGILAGPAGALLGGRATDRIGPRRTLTIVLAGWVGVLVAAAAVPLLGLPTAFFWAIAPLTGMALGANGAVDRPYLLRLAPGDAIGQSVGLLGTVGRLSAVTGPLVWALVVDVLRLGRPSAVLFLAGFVLAGIAILQPLADHPALER